MAGPKMSFIQRYGTTVAALNNVDTSTAIRTIICTFLQLIPCPLEQFQKIFMTVLFLSGIHGNQSAVIITVSRPHLQIIAARRKGIDKGPLKDGYRKEDHRNHVGLDYYPPTLSTSTTLPNQTVTVH